MPICVHRGFSRYRSNVADALLCCFAGISSGGKAGAGAHEMPRLPMPTSPFHLPRPRALEYLLPPAIPVRLASLLRRRQATGCKRVLTASSQACAAESNPSSLPAQESGQAHSTTKTGKPASPSQCRPSALSVVNRESMRQNSRRRDACCQAKSSGS